MTPTAKSPPARLSLQNPDRPAIFLDIERHRRGLRVEASSSISNAVVILDADDEDALLAFLTARLVARKGKAQPTASSTAEWARAEALAHKAEHEAKLPRPPQAPTWAAKPEPLPPTTRQIDERLRREATAHRPYPRNLDEARSAHAAALTRLNREAVPFAERQDAASFGSMGEGNEAAMPHPTDPTVGELIGDECLALKDMLLVKNAAYGNSALDPVRIFSQADPVEQLKVRLDDKLSRLSRGDMGDSDLEDVELDLLGYLILLRVARRSA